MNLAKPKSGSGLEVLILLLYVNHNGKKVFLGSEIQKIINFGHLIVRRVA